jgi:flagellar basal body-associated protein FliL
MAQLIPDDRARQGGSGRPVLGVLVGALLLLAVSVAGYMMWAASSSPDDPGTDAARANTTGSTTGSSNSNPTNRISPANPAYPAPNAQPSANEAPKQ